MSSPALTAIGLACSEGNLATATTNTLLGLGAATDITGKYVTSVTAAGSSATAGTVTIVMKAIGSAVTAGDTIIYTAACDPDSGTTWTVSGTIATKFYPKT